MPPHITHVLNTSAMLDSRIGVLDKLVAAFKCLGLHIDFETWFGEWKIMRTKPDRSLLPEKLVHEKLESAFKIGTAHVLINIETFDLLKLCAVCLIHFVRAIGVSRSKHPNRRSA